MATSNELNQLTLADLGLIAKEILIPGWSKMRKEELVQILVSKSRSKAAGDVIRRFLAASRPKFPGSAKKPDKSALGTTKFGGTNKPAVSKPDAGKITGKNLRPTSKESPQPLESAKRSASPAAIAVPRFLGKDGLRRDISTRPDDGKPDRLVLMVRDPFWLHVYWEISAKTIERVKVALGHFWYSSAPVLRLYRLSSDGTGAPKRDLIRTIPIHGGVQNWYLDVVNPPSAFIVELGYLITKENRFHPILSSNIVETPQQQVVDELDKLDGNWKGVAEDLSRVFKLTAADGNSQELRDVMEEQLGRPMTPQLLSRYRAAKQGGGEKPRRNFHFAIKVDMVIHGKTESNVQVSIRNEPVPVKPDGTFRVCFPLPEKRHLFPIEAEGSDGVEMQRVILTLERNTRVLETVIQEPSEDD